MAGGLSAGLSDSTHLRRVESDRVSDWTMEVDVGRSEVVGCLGEVEV